MELNENGPEVERNDSEMKWSSYEDKMSEMERKLVGETEEISEIMGMLEADRSRSRKDSQDRISDVKTGEESRCSQYFKQLSAQEINGLCRVSIVESKNSRKLGTQSG